MNPSPFHGIFSALQQEQGQMTETPEQPVERAEVPPAQSTKAAVQKGQIAVDIYEQEGYYIIRAPIAGVKLADLDIEVDDKVLTIKGSREQSDSIPEDQYYLKECFWGEFSRSITLPVAIDPKRVKATFSKDSILKVLIPKEERVKIVRVSEA